MAYKSINLTQKQLEFHLKTRGGTNLASESTNDDYRQKPPLLTTRNSTGDDSLIAEKDGRNNDEMILRDKLRKDVSVLGGR